MCVMVADEGVEDDIVKEFQKPVRNFVDSGVIGSREFVERVGRQLKEKMPERKERSAHTFRGLSGLCTLKRLAPG